MTDNIIDAKNRFGSKAVIELKPTGVPLVDATIKRAARKHHLFIREWRYLRGMSMNDLAFKMGVSQQWVAQVERADRPVNSDKLVLLAQALGIEVAALFKNPTASRETYPA